MQHRSHNSFNTTAQRECGATEYLCNKVINAALSLYLEDGTHLAMEEVVTVTLRVSVVARAIVGI